MNSCVAILILKMEENMQHFGILCFFISRKVKTQLKHKNDLCRVYREGAVTDRMCQTWFAKFCAGDFSLDDAPNEVDGDQMEALTEKINILPHWREQIYSKYTNH